MFLTNNFTCRADDRKVPSAAGRWNCSSNGSNSICGSKPFYGTSDNAVKTQVWIAISVYVLVAIVKKELRLERSLERNFANSEPVTFRENPAFSGTQRAKNREIRNRLSLTN